MSENSSLKTTIKFVKDQYKNSGLFNSIYLDPVQERNLLVSAKNCQKSRDKLIKAFFKLAFKEAVKFYRLNHKNVELEDLVNSATEGLLKGIDNFDLNKENRFSTYCQHWIKDRLHSYTRSNSSIIKYLTSKDDLEVYNNLSKSIKKITKVDKECKNLNEHEKEQIAKDLQKDKKNIDKIINCLNTKSINLAHCNNDSVKEEYVDELNEINNVNLNIDINKILDQKENNIYKLAFEQDLSSEQIAQKTNSNRETIRQQKIAIKNKIANYLS